MNTGGMTSPAPAIVQAPRDLSLDSFRGTDVLLMILVNVQGNDDAAFPMLKHAQWNGMTFADLVFPVFLLIVGLSAPLAFDRPGAIVRWPAILRRTGLLFLIGVGLSLLIRPTLDLDMIRWTGVLQRIAIVYLVCVAVIVMRRGIGLAAGLSMVLLLLHTYMLLFVGAPAGAIIPGTDLNTISPDVLAQPLPPGAMLIPAVAGGLPMDTGPSMDPGMGISGWLDQNFIPGRVLRKTWEPEGVLSTLPAIANGLIGVAIMRWMQSGRGNTARLAILGAMLLAAGLAATCIVPLNKNLWTASFTLATCGIGALVWSALRAAWPRIGGDPVMRWTVGLGQAALTLYIVHTVLIAIIVRKLPSGQTIWDSSFQGMLAIGLSPAITSLFYAIIACAISCMILVPLQRRGWILKV